LEALARALGFSSQLAIAREVPAAAAQDKAAKVVEKSPRKESDAAGEYPGAASDDPPLGHVDSPKAGRNRAPEEPGVEETGPGPGKYKDGVTMEASGTHGRRGSRTEGAEPQRTAHQEAHQEAAPTGSAEAVTAPVSKDRTRPTQPIVATRETEEPQQAAEIEALEAQVAALLQELDAEKSGRVLAEARADKKEAEREAQLVAAEAERETLKAAFEFEKAAKTALEGALRAAVEARVRAAKAAELQTKEASGTEGTTTTAASFRMIVDTGVVPSERCGAALGEFDDEIATTVALASHAEQPLVLHGPEEIQGSGASLGRCLPEARC